MDKKRLNFKDLTFWLTDKELLELKEQIDNLLHRKTDINTNALQDELIKSDQLKPIKQNSAYSLPPSSGTGIFATMSVNPFYGQDRVVETFNIGNPDFDKFLSKISEKNKKQSVITKFKDKRRKKRKGLW